jgi:hypothetical protein
MKTEPISLNDGTFADILITEASKHLIKVKLTVIE